MKLSRSAILSMLRLQRSKTTTSLRLSHQREDASCSTLTSKIPPTHSLGKRTGKGRKVHQQWLPLWRMKQRVAQRRPACRQVKKGAKMLQVPAICIQINSCTAFSCSAAAPTPDESTFLTRFVPAFQFQQPELLGMVDKVCTGSISITVRHGRQDLCQHLSSNSHSC